MTNRSHQVSQWSFVYHQVNSTCMRMLSYIEIPKALYDFGIFSLTNARTCELPRTSQVSVGHPTEWASPAPNGACWVIPSQVGTWLARQSRRGPPLYDDVIYEIDMTGLIV